MFDQDKAEAFKKIIEGIDNDEVFAVTIMEYAHKELTEDNFTYYAYIMLVIMRIAQLKRDGVLTEKRAASVHKQCALIFDEMIEDYGRKCAKGE